MQIFAVAFCAGVLGLQQSAELPHPLWALLPCIFVPLAWRLPRTCARPLLAGLAGGFGWAMLHALATAPAELPSGTELATDVRAKGTVIGLPAVRGGMARFLFDVRELGGAGRVHPGSWRLRLSWHRPPQLVPGQQWELPVRLRRARSYANPGSWDYAGWLYRRGVRHTGYVRDRQPALLLATHDCCAVQRLRHTLAAAIAAEDVSPLAAGVLRALALGDKSGLGQADRQLFAGLGISHLFAISGLHIGLFAALAYGIVGGAWRRCALLAEYAPAQLAAASAGLLAGAAYAVLSGLDLPAQRALIMLAVAWFSLAGRRERAPGDALGLAAVLVLAWSPGAVNEAGFWLSFSAVAAILAGTALTRGRPRWYRVVAVQLIIGCALWPVLGWFGMAGNLLAPAVNLLLVPLFGLVLVPLALLAVGLVVALPAAASPLVGLLGAGIDVLHAGLQSLAAWAAPFQYLARPGPAQSVAGAVGVLLLLAAPGFPWRGLAVPLVLVAAWPRAPDIPPGGVRIAVLDVGQGLAAVVQTRAHTLVYDTGPTFRSGFNTADAVITPYLETIGVTRIDRLVLSHGDNDHASGAANLLRRWPVGQVDLGEPRRTPVPGRRCRAGDGWTWDGITFSYLHPPPGQSSGNDASCVLRVRHPRGDLLLTGDIEEGSERRLLEHAELGPVALVSAPHHGSLTSSSVAFVAALRARHVVMPVGWHNRYGFPKRAVVRRWTTAGSRVWRTDRDGAVILDLFPGSEAAPRAVRPGQRRYWH